MKRGVILFFVVFLVQLMVTVILSCKKGSGILGPGYVKPTPTVTFTPDVNYRVLIHQSGTPVAGVNLVLTYNNDLKLKTTTGNNGIGSFKVNEYGNWSLLVNSFDDYTSQVFVVDPHKNTFTAIDYGIPTLELNLVSGKEEIPVSPSSITYTVKYRTKFERKKYILFNCPEGINVFIFQPKIVANDGDELTVRLDIKKSFEGYTVNKKHLPIYAYTQGNATEQKPTTSNVRTLTKNWMFNVTVDYYFMTLFAHDMDNAKTCYYAGIKNVDMSKSTNIFLSGELKFEVKEYHLSSSGDNITIYFGHSSNCMPWFTSYSCCNFSYGCFDALAKINTNKSEQWSWRDGMEANGYIKVRFYDDMYFDVVRRFETRNGWSPIYYHWCCTSRDITRARCSCKNNNISESCLYFWDSVKCADITRYRHERINVTE